MTEPAASSSRSASPPSFKERVKQRKRQLGHAVFPDDSEDKSVDLVLDEGPKSDWLLMSWRHGLGIDTSP